MSDDELTIDVVCDGRKHREPCFVTRWRRLETDTGHQWSQRPPSSAAARRHPRFLDPESFTDLDEAFRVPLDAFFRQHRLDALEPTGKVRKARQVWLRDDVPTTPLLLGRDFRADPEAAARHWRVVYVHECPRCAASTPLRGEKLDRLFGQAVAEGRTALTLRDLASGAARLSDTPKIRTL